MWRLSNLSSPKGAGAATAGVIFAVSSWRSFLSSSDRDETEREKVSQSQQTFIRFQKYHRANCTSTIETSSSGRFVYGPSVCRIPSTPHHQPTGKTQVKAEGATNVESFRSSSQACGVAIAKSRRLIRRAMLERGIPGAVVAVVKDGQLVWSEGLGYADVENEVPCTPDTSMRIASISKPLTAIALLQLWQRGKVDLDAPIQKYVPEFPVKEYDGEKVKITTRQLLSHTAGIRHYSRKVKKESIESGVGKPAAKEFDAEEYYISSHYDSVLESLKIFANDELLSKPGSEYNYTTHGWTLISAVIEKVSDKNFLQYMSDHVFRPLGMSSTGGEFHKPLVYNRARHYVRCADGLLQNTPYIDISYKWAGGGFISTAEDLTKFGNAVLTCYQLNSIKKATESNTLSSQYSTCKADQKLCDNQMVNNTTIGHKCILEPNTIAMMWTPVVFPYKSKPGLGYGIGWLLKQADVNTVGGREQLFYAAHSGGSVGASSILVVMPSKTGNTTMTVKDAVTEQPKKIEEMKFAEYDQLKEQDKCGFASEYVNGVHMRPSGVVVAVLFNLQEVKEVTSLGVQIAEEFL